MPLQFSCSACRTLHPSRLRIDTPGLVPLVMGAFGQVLEPCPATGEWIAVRAEDLRWEGGPALPESNPLLS